MKNFITAICLALAGVAAAANIVTLYNGSEARISTPSKVCGVRAVSSVASGTAAVKSITSLLAVRDVITSTSLTNTLYTLVYSNGVNVVTNTTAVEAELKPLPPPRALISFTTNSIISINTVTNSELFTAAVITNTIADLTCAGGFVEQAVSNKFLLPSDRIFFTGTARGSVTVFGE